MSWFTRVRVLVAIGFVLAVGVFALLQPVRVDRRTRRAKASAGDAVTQETARYRDAVTSLPVSGSIGFLPPDTGHPSDRTMRYFVAQYALTPRVIVLGTDADYVIAIPEASPADDEPTGTASRDSRLTNFMLIKRLASGVRIYRRLT